MCKGTWLPQMHTKALAYTVHLVLEAVQADDSMCKQEMHMRTDMKLT